MKSAKPKLINPTVILWLAILVPFVTVLGASFQYGESFGPLGWGATFLFQLFIVFMAFTPLHESAHGIASRNKRLNEGMLLSCSLFFLADTGLFRALHVTHHAKTNMGEEDPDHFTSAPTLAGRWIRSFALIAYYHLFAWKRFRRTHRAIFYRSFPSLLYPFALLAVSASNGHLTWALLAWVIPSITAAGLLSFVNTAWPHDVGGEVSRFKNTRIHQLPGWAQALMCNQNLHLVHHMQPTLPWWKYPEVWSANREKWTSQGAAVFDYRR